MRSAFLALVLGSAAVASADGYWHVESFYNYGIDTATYGAGADLHDLEVAMTVGSTDGSYIDLTPGTSSIVSGATGVGYDYYYSNDYPFLGTNLSQPVVKTSFLFGVLDGLNGDVPGQHHLVVFTNPDAALNEIGVTYDQVFATSAQPYQLTEDSVIDALLHVHRNDLSDADKVPYYDTLTKFRDSVVRNANIGPGGATTGDSWFTPAQGFDLVSFSTGAVVGTGTQTINTTFNTVPEPSSFAALFGGVGVLAARRRRRRS